MVFDVPTLIEYFSSFMTLYPGDVILTGTPDGVVDCPVGVVVCEIEGIGALQHHRFDRIGLQPAPIKLEQHENRPSHRRQGGRRPRLLRDRQPRHAGGAGRGRQRRRGRGARRGGRGQGRLPKWAGLPATERAKKMRKLGDLIARHVPEIARTETDDTGQVIAQTGKQLVPRAADNFTTSPRCARAWTATPTPRPRT
jgi:hypothetical protein